MFHEINIIGNLGRDPEMRYAPNGMAVTNMSLAASRTYTSKSEGKITETIWFRISAWGTMAENCQKYLKKGARVMVKGRLAPDPETGGPKIWTKQDGTPSASFEVRANQVIFLSSKSEIVEEPEEEPAF